MRRPRSFQMRWLYRGLLGASLAAIAIPARADIEHGRGIDAEIYRPALDPLGIFSIERAVTMEKNDFALRLGVDFAPEPLKIDSLQEASDQQFDGNPDRIIDSRTALNFGFAFGLGERLTLGFEIPIFVQPLGPGYGEYGLYKTMAADSQVGTGFYSTRPDQNIDPAENTIGDLRLGLKLRLARSLAVQLVGWLPFGDEDVFAGSASATIEPKLIYEMGLGRKGHLAFNGGARIRQGDVAEVQQVDAEKKAVLDADGNQVLFPKLYVGSEGLVGMGAMFELSPRFSFGGDVHVLFPLTQASAADCPDSVTINGIMSTCQNGDIAGEVILGAALDVTTDLRFNIGAGTSIIPDAARSENFRVVGGITWQPSVEGGRVSARGDSDGDGIPDGPDACPDEPEDNDGFQDDDGCPELDNDLDGVLDAQDKCANEPEDRDGYDDNDGCPEGDNDADGIPDVSDRCPKEKEDKDGYDDDDGCPDEDNDGDGILDAKDQCPDEPETVNGYQDLDGCPDQGAQGGPKLTTAEIDLQGERVDFAGKSDNLTKAAQQTLDVVAAIMKANPRVRFRIEVGVEESGTKKKDKAADQSLTNRRADAVRQYLLDKGVSGPQLDVAGLGSDRPIDKEPRSPKNRRVQFIRLNQ
jgi:outer membrane protein OmpA-like peptidoglycan-associated protein